MRIRFVEVNSRKGWVFISASSWFIVCVNALVRVDGVALIPGVGGPQGFVSHARVCQIHGIAMAVPTAAVSRGKPGRHVPAISNAFWLRVPFSTISFGSPPIQALAASGLVWPRGRFAVGRGAWPRPRPPPPTALLRRRGHPSHVLQDRGRPGGSNGPLTGPERQKDRQIPNNAV